MKKLRIELSANCLCYWALSNTDMYSNEYKSSLFCVCNLSIEQSRWKKHIRVDSTHKQEHRSHCASNFSCLFSSFLFFSFSNHVWQRWDICHSVAYSCTSNPKYQCSCVWESRLWNSWNNDVFGSWKKKKYPIVPNVFHCNMNKWQFPGCFESWSFFIIESFISIF